MHSNMYNPEEPLDIGSLVHQERVDKIKHEYEALKASLKAELTRRQGVAHQLEKTYAANVAEALKRHKTLMTGLEQDRTESQRKLDTELLNASTRCSEIGVEFVPGQTSGDDVLSVPPATDSKFVAQADLPFGAGIPLKFESALKIPLALSCNVMTSASVGITFKLVQPRNLTANPAGLAISIVIGALTALGIMAAVGLPWRMTGTKVGSLRPSREVFGLLVPIATVTLAIMIGLGSLDTKAISSMEAASVRLNPALATPSSTLALIGLVLSAVYVLAVGASGFMQGYNGAAARIIADHKRDDEVARMSVRSQEVTPMAALNSLSAVRVAQQRLEALTAQISQADIKNRQEIEALEARMPVVSRRLEPEELRSLNDLKQRLQIAQEALDNYRTSRSPKGFLK